MKGPAIDRLVYECMFPRPKTTDPQGFQQLLQRQLIPEVRLETQAYYGHLNSQEAKYPGLDYSYQPHRTRLSRYPWHRRLFRAFENLGLTKSEIASLTKWEGTRWAKERFENEQGIIIEDSIGTEIKDWIEPELRVPEEAHAAHADGDDMDDILEEGEGEEDEMEDEGEESDNEMASVGVDLNERLIVAAAARESGNPSAVMDEEWEQWLKEVAERGGLPYLSTAPNANIPGTRPATTISAETSALHPRLLNAARLGQWQQIPDHLQNIVRENMEANNRRNEDAPITSPSQIPSTPYTVTSRYSARTPLGPRLVNSTPLSPRLHRNETRIARLDNHFADHFSRRTIPAPPASSANTALSEARSRIRLGPYRGYPDPSSGS